MADFMAAKRLAEDMAKIAAEFIDENGRTLAERGRRTRFLNRDGTVTKHGDPEHAAIWQQHEAALLLETAHLIEAMKGAKFSAWCAALRIVGVRQGINLPLRPGDHDPDESGEI
jgi:sugar diacid utilization regulator